MDSRKTAFAGPNLVTVVPMVCVRVMSVRMHHRFMLMPVRMPDPWGTRAFVGMLVVFLV